GPGAEHEAGVVRRRRHDDSTEQAPTVIQRAEGASLERRGEHDASALLDVVRADGDLCGREQPSVERVDAEGAVVTTRHVGTAGEKRDVLRRGVGAERPEEPHAPDVVDADRAPVARAHPYPGAVRREADVVREVRRAEATCDSWASGVGEIQD